MKPNLLQWSAIVLAPVAMLVWTSCSSAPTGEETTVAAYQEGVPGGVIVKSSQTTATVTGIDAANRRVTLVSPEGKKSTFKAGPEVVNFGQLQVGDQVKATVVEELVVFLRGKGEQANDGQAAAIALAPVGAKPGVVMADTVQFTAKITGLDLERHCVTLQFADGSIRITTVRPDVDLTKRQIGEEVVIRSTEALAILVEKP